MDESVTTRQLSAELPMNDGVLIPWGPPSMYIAVSKPAGTERVVMKLIRPWWYPLPCYALPGKCSICADLDTFGSLEPPKAVSETFQRSPAKRLFRRIISDDTMVGDYGGYGMDNDNDATPVLRRIQEFRAAVDKLIREPGSKSLQLAMEEARTAACYSLMVMDQNSFFTDSRPDIKHVPMDASLTSLGWNVPVEFLPIHKYSDFSESWSVEEFADFFGKPSIRDDCVPRKKAASEDYEIPLFTTPLVFTNRWRSMLDIGMEELYQKRKIMEELRTAVGCAYHLCSRLMKELLNVSFTSPWLTFGLPSQKARDLSRLTSFMKLSLIKEGVDDTIIVGDIMKQLRFLGHLELQVPFFLRYLCKNFWASQKFMTTFPWIVVNGPEEHPSCVPQEGAGIGAATKEENCTDPGTWLVATAAPHHATGNRELLTGFTPDEDRFLQAGDGTPMEVRGRGAVVTDAVVLPDVWFVPGLTANLVSAGQLAELGYAIEFARGACRIVEGGGSVAGEARIGEDGLFELQFLKLPLAM